MVQESPFPNWKVLFSDNYRPQHSCGKVMFLHLSVILFTPQADTPPGQTPLLGRQSPLSQAPPWADTNQADTPWAETPPRQTPPGKTHTTRQAPPWADTPYADTPRKTLPWADTPKQTPPPRANGHCSRRYASYWNAFLLLVMLWDFFFNRLKILIWRHNFLTFSIDLDLDVLSRSKKLPRHWL